MKNTLEKKAMSTIKDHHLNLMINTWIEDIKEGYRETNLTLNLPPIGLEKLSQINDQGNQELPSLIHPNLSGFAPTLGMLPPLDHIFNS